MAMRKTFLTHKITFSEFYFYPYTGHNSIGITFVTQNVDVENVFDCVSKKLI